jgi:subtilisin family serine protease
MTRFPKTLRHDSGGEMRLDETRLLLSFREEQRSVDVDRVLVAAGIRLEMSGEQGEKNGRRSGVHEAVNHTEYRFWVRSNDAPVVEDGQAAEAVRNAAETLGPLAWIGPVYRMEGTSGLDGLVCPLPTALVVRFARDAAGRGPAKLKRYGLREVPERSKYLGDFRYFELGESANGSSAYDLRDALLSEEGDVVTDAFLEHMPLIVPLTIVPNDPMYPQQWNMARIQAGGAGLSAWDISTGAAGVVVCVMDTGVDQTHPDIQLAGPGVNLGTMMPTGAPAGNAHGTACAGIVAGSYNNATGVAGVAGNCRILPARFQNWTDAEVAGGINWAVANGANVISMSFGTYFPGEGTGPVAGWNVAVIDPAIAAATGAGVVLCAATGNENLNTFNRYPGRNPAVIACGASDQSDNRKSPASPDGECWGSNFAPGVSVVAPGVLCPTTDIQGAGGYNNTGGPGSGPCVTYPSTGDAAGDYYSSFNGTSAATPHVAGLAALLRSRYPALTGAQIRAVIERTADKVGTTAYAEAPGFPNGTRNQQMGYGRINAYRSLDFADVLIKDWPGDDGVEPSTPAGGDFWDYSDIVVRPTDDTVFMPGDPMQSSNVERGQTNYIYVRVTNNGPAAARNVVVDCRIAAYAGTQFTYPLDWTAVDATHIAPTPLTASFATVPAGDTAVAKFSVSAAQVDTLWNWVNGMSWHPCMLARVQADNDYAFAGAGLTGTPIVVRRNNLAQRNLSVVDVLTGAPVTFPFVAGAEKSRAEAIELVLDRSRIPEEIEVLLALDDDGKAFPMVDFDDIWDDRIGKRDDGLQFLRRTHIRSRIGARVGVLTLEKGSRIEWAPHPRLENVKVEGGEVVLRDGNRYVVLRDPVVHVYARREPGRRYPLSIRLVVPEQAEPGERYLVTIAQREGRNTVGGVGALFVVRQ